VELTAEERERADKTDPEAGRKMKQKQYEERMFKTDKDGIRWRSDGNGGWLCIGRSEYFQEIADAKKKSILLEKKRLNLLDY
jgi:hypothetical protein